MGNQIGDAGMADFSRAIASGSLGSLQKLSLYGNQIGDAGMADFSRAIASGSLPDLKGVCLGGNPGRDAPVKKALAARLWAADFAQSPDSAKGCL